MAQITFSGPAAAFLTPVRHLDGSWGIKLTGTYPTVGSYALVITEALPVGYDNSPRVSTLTIAVTSEQPQQADLSNGQINIAFLIRLKPDTQVALAGRVTDPGDRFWLYLDHSDLAAGRTLAGLEYWGWNDAAGVLGWRTGKGDLRPKYDPATCRVAVYCYCDPEFQQSAGFNQRVQGGLRTRVRFAGADSQSAEDTAIVPMEQR